MKNYRSFIKENRKLSAKTMSPEQIAKKHDVSVEYVNRQLDAGMKIEREHTKNPDIAREIALDHLGENPRYYVKLKKYVESSVRIGTLIRNEFGEMGKVLSLRENSVVYNVKDTGIMKKAKYGEFEIVEAVGSFTAPPYYFGGVEDAPKDKQEEERKLSQDKDLSDDGETSPSKYYKNLDPKTKEERRKHFRTQNRKHWDDPSAYNPAPGDKAAKTKPSKHTLKYRELYGESITGDEEMNEEAEKGLAAKAKKSGVSLSTLKKVYNRGMAAWRGGHRPGTTPQQWGMARVNSFITKGKGTYYGADSDLSGQSKKKKKKMKENLSTDYVGTTGSNVPYYGSYDKSQFHNESIDEAFESFINETNHDRDVNLESRGECGYVGMGKEDTDHSYSGDQETPSKKKSKASNKKSQKTEDYPGGDYNPKLSGAPLAVGGLSGGQSIYGVQEDMLPNIPSIRAWVMKETTQVNFLNRYGEHAAEKLVEAAHRMANAKTSFLSFRKKLDEADYAPQAFPMSSGSDEMGMSTPETGYSKMGIGEEDEEEVVDKKKTKKINEDVYSEIQRCLTEGVDLIDNNYRLGSEKFFELFRVARDLELQLEGYNKYLIEQTDIGEIVEHNGSYVPLDCPMIEEEAEEKNPPLNRPKRGGTKKFYVYVRDPQTKNIKKVSWGDTTGLSVRMNDPEARKSFAARHRCSAQKDRTTPAYWACNTPRYAKQLGLSGGGNFYW